MNATREQVRSSVPLRRVGFPPFAVYGALVAFQALLGVAMGRSGSIATAIAGLTFLGGMWFVFTRNTERMFQASAYIAGSETLWRMTHAKVPYTLAAYAVILILGYAIVTRPGAFKRRAGLALGYIGLLSVSGLKTIAVSGGNAREYLAFALAGPVALAVGVLYFSNVRATQALFRQGLWALTFAACGVAGVAAESLRSYQASAGNLAGTFADQSNFVASNGFGPVQVSSMLGLGVVTATMLAITERNKGLQRLEILLAVWLSVQSFLTFSRGGMLSALLAIGLYVVHLLRSRSDRVRALAVAAALFVLGWFVIFPALNNFTNGAFDQRFSDSSTGRTSLAANDLTIFRHNFFLGVGPGMTKFARVGYVQCQARLDKCNNEASSHTEFTRMLSEHGVLGLLAALVLLRILLQVYLSAPPGGARARVAMLFAWSVSQMFYANMRIVAVPYIFALACLALVDDGSDPGIEAGGRAVRDGLLSLLGRGPARRAPEPAVPRVPLGASSAPRPGGSVAFGIARSTDAGPALRPSFGGVDPDRGPGHQPGF